jgi:hypothetical protein
MLRQTAKIVQPVTVTSSTHNNNSSDTTTRYLSSPLWASGFSFCEASGILDVPYDPSAHYLFFGEEVSMAAR